MDEAQALKELSGLLRGFFATPVLSSLGRAGVLEKAVQLERFSVQDFPEIANSMLLEQGFDYLARIGLLKKRRKHYRISEQGREIFLRVSSFYVPHSYAGYLYHFHERLHDPAAGVDVERRENVQGSGETHMRYFLPAISFLKRKVDFDVLVDVGCGNGHFLSSALKTLKGKKAVGVDFSEVSVSITDQRLAEDHPETPRKVIHANALDVRQWSAQANEFSNGAPLALSMWFLLHEISSADPARVVEFLNRVHNRFPASPLIIGEIADQGPDVLGAQPERSLMPEYLFFHEMSGQGVMPWTTWAEILEQTPYIIKMERRFDELETEDQELIPASFVWCLTPEP